MPARSAKVAKVCRTLERSERDRLQRHGADACCGLRTLDAAVSISAADVRDARIGINVAVLERDPLSRPQGIRIDQCPLTARPSTWRSACVASKRCPPAIVMRHVAISVGRS